MSNTLGWETRFTCSQLLGLWNIWNNPFTCENRCTGFVCQRGVQKEVPILKTDPLWIEHAKYTNRQCADTRLHDQIFRLENWYPRDHLYDHVQVFASVYMAVWRVIANIPVLRGLLAACKLSQTTVINI